VIASDAAVSGWPSFELASSQSDHWRNNQNEAFNRWSINLNDDDLREIFKSHGFIAFTLDRYRLAGLQVNQALGDHSQTDARSDRLLRKQCTAILAAQLFHVVNVIRQAAPHRKRDAATRDAWTMLGIGSGFDGMIELLPAYRSVSDMPRLADDLTAFFEAPADVTVYSENREVRLRTVVLQELMAGYSPRELATMITGGNYEKFLSKYFTKAYLEKGELPLLDQPEIPEEIPQALVTQYVSARRV
jgi:hypothetical protein